MESIGEAHGFVLVKGNKRGKICNTGEILGWSSSWKICKYAQS